MDAGGCNMSNTAAEKEQQQQRQQQDSIGGMCN
jgi:hypothetical protein